MENEIRKHGYFASPVVITAASIVIIAGVVAARAIITPLILAIFVSIICAQPVAWLIKKKIPQPLAIFLVLLGLIALVGSVGLLLGSSFYQFSKNIPTYTASLNSVFETTLDRFNIAEDFLSIDFLKEKIDVSKVFGFTAGAIGQLVSILSNSFIILLVTVFILAESSAFGLKAKLLEKIYGKPLDFLTDFRKSVRRYLSLKTVISFATGVFITIWLTIIGVDFALLWGVMAFFLNFIPNIGSIIAAIPPTFLALVQFGPSGVIFTVLGFFIVNTVFGNILEPRILGKGLSLSPLFVFLSLIVWGAMLGIIGMFLAVPLTLIMKIGFNQVEGTKWISILMSSEKDAKKMCDEGQIL
jgi:AI-2 transport protein TqsA